MDLITAIALWCSSPSQYRLSVSDINNCREKMMKCWDEQVKENVLKASLYKCAKTIKLGE